MQIDFSDKNVIVTGSSQGIGKKIAEIFAASGAHVVLSDIDQEALDTTRQEFADKGF